MAQYILKGGPCNNRTGTFTVAIADSGQVTCQNRLYQRSNPLRRIAGRQVFDVVPVGANQGSGGGAQYAPNVYKAWGVLQKGINHDLPTSMRAIGIAERRLIQKLAHQHRGRR